MSTDHQLFKTKVFFIIAILISTYYLHFIYSVFIYVVIYVRYKISAINVTCYTFDNLNQKKVHSEHSFLEYR